MLVVRGDMNHGAEKNAQTFFMPSCICGEMYAQKK